MHLGCLHVCNACNFLLLFPNILLHPRNYFFRPFYVQYRLRYCTHPLAFPRSGDAASASRFRLRECTTFGAFPQAGTGTEIITNLRLRGCNILVAIPQAELSALDSIPARGNVNFHVHLRSRGRRTEIITQPPLAGMQYFGCISASGIVSAG